MLDECECWLHHVLKGGGGGGGGGPVSDGKKTNWAHVGRLASARMELAL